MNILVVDVGGSHVKCIASGRKRPARFKSGPKMTPQQMMKSLLDVTKDWRYDVVSIGYPGVVRHDQITREPYNLGRGWMGFGFQGAFGRPVKVVNDAAMQALGGYEGGKMLFLGLGTGLGSALIVDGVIADLELGHLPYKEGQSYEYFVGEQGRRRFGNDKWRSKVMDVVEDLRNALLPDYVVLGGGNAVRLGELPPQTHFGKNTNAFLGGYRLWKPASHTTA